MGVKTHDDKKKQNSDILLVRGVAKSELFNAKTCYSTPPSTRYYLCSKSVIMLIAASLMAGLTW